MQTHNTTSTHTIVSRTPHPAHPLPSTICNIPLLQLIPCRPPPPHTHSSINQLPPHHLYLTPSQPRHKHTACPRHTPSPHPLHLSSRPSARSSPHSRDVEVLQTRERSDRFGHDPRPLISKIVEPAKTRSHASAQLPPPHPAALLTLHPPTPSPRSRPVPSLQPSPPLHHT